MLIDRPKTKIICTLGPATSSDGIVQSLIENGMSIARLNMSHGDLDEHSNAVKRVRRISEKLDTPVGIMVDVPGVKYRTGPLGTGILNLIPTDKITLTSRDVTGTTELVAVFPSGIHLDARIGQPVLLDDGLIELRILDIQQQDVQCEVIRGGRLTERRGVALPGQTTSHQFPDEQSIQALIFAAKHNVDFVAISTVRNHLDITRAKEILIEYGHTNTHIISKIERSEAIDNFSEILDVSDSIMVARGDMGVEIKLSQVPIVQKELIATCNAKGKPAITATQMLESMLKSPVPTRAEVTDVANSIYDGTDAIMLSGETSVGEYPVEAVKVMAEVAYATEAALPYEKMIVEKRKQLLPKTDDAISYDACQTAQQLNASLIVAFTESGSTAGRVSKYRPRPPILALTPDKEVQRKLTIQWGVTPKTIRKVRDINEFFAVGEEYAAQTGNWKTGSVVVLVAGLPIGVRGGTNLLRVLTFPSSSDPT